jgi:hypothetical protein
LPRSPTTRSSLARAVAPDLFLSAPPAVNGTSGAAQGGALYNLAYGNNVNTGAAVTASVTLDDSILAGTIGGTNDLVSREVDGGNVNNTGNSASVAGAGPNIVVASSNVGHGANGTSTLDTSTFLTGATNSNIGVAASLASNGGPTQTLALAPGGSAIAAGTIADYPGTSTPITTDQRGDTRKATPDLGAYEAQSLATTTTVIATPSSGDVYGQSVTLTATVTSAAATPTTGSVTFVDTTTGTTLGSADVNSSGQAEITTSELTAATHTITASYSDTPATNFAGSSGQLSNYSVAAGTATHFSVSAPGSATAGVGFSITVTALTAGNATATGYTGTVAFTSSDIAALGLPSNYTFTVGAGGDGGVHTFTNGVTLVTAGTQSVTATDTVTGSITGSSNITVTAAASSKLVVTQQPSTMATAGVAFAAQPVVAEEDQFGNLENSDSTHTVTVALGNHGTATLQGSQLTLTLQNGIASFSGLSYDKAETMNLGFRTSAGSFTATSNDVVVSAAAANHLAFGVQPSNTAAGVSISPAVTVRVFDQFDNLVTSDTSNVTLAIGTNPGGGTLSGTLTQAAVGGIASFSTLSLNKVGTGYTLSASDGSLGGAPSNMFNITPAAASQLVFGVQPGDTIAGVAISPAVTVYIEDQFGNLVTNDNTDQVTVDVASGLGAFTVGSTTTQTAVGGMASFSNLVLDKSGAYTLGENATGDLTGKNSNSFAVSPAAVAQLAVIAPANATAGTPFSVTVTAQDQFANVVIGYQGTVHFTKSDTGSGSAVPADYSFVLADDGVHTFSNAATLVSSGPQMITATDTITGTADITVADQQLTNLVGANLPSTGLEGTSIGAVTGIATFSDAQDDAATNYTATIDWGDTTNSPGTVVMTTAGNYRVDAPEHTYAEEGAYNVAVTVKHSTLSAVPSGSQAITVADQQITNLASANLPATGVEGSAIVAITGIATFTDPAGAGVETTTDFAATINWGDTNTSAGTIVSLGGGSYSVNAPSHTYAQEGNYTVNVTLTHDGLPSLPTPNQFIVVADATLSPSPAALPAFTAFSPSGVVTLGTFTDSYALASGDPQGISEFTATINWGDSSSSAGTIAQSAMNSNLYTVTGSHTYMSHANFTVSVNIADAGGQMTTLTDSATANRATPTFSVSDTGGVYNGKPYPATGNVLGVGNSPIHIPVFSYALASDPNFTHPLAGAPTSAGSYLFKASFAGSGDYLPATTTGSFLITPATPVFSALSNPTINYRTGTTAISGKLSLGALIPTGSVVITLNGVQHSATLHADGSFSFSFNTASLPVGKYTVQYSYAGAGNFAAASGASTLNVTFGFTPLLNNGHTYKTGTTILVQLVLVDPSGREVENTNTTVTATGLALASSPSKILPLPSGNTPGGKFVADDDDDFFYINLKTTGLAAGKYVLYFTMTGDPVVHTFAFTISA